MKKYAAQDGPDERGENVRLIVGLVSVMIWVVFGGIVLFSDVNVLGRIGAILAAALALFVITWAWEKAATANDFLTATSTVRLVMVIFGVVTVYALVANMVGDPAAQMPSAVNTYVLDLLTNLVSIVGFVLILFTDFVRCFTIPLRRRNRVKRVECDARRSRLAVANKD